VRRGRSNTNTDIKKFETVLEEGNVSNPDSSDDSSEDTLGQHVRKHVITHDDSGRKQQLTKFKSFVRTKKLKNGKQTERRLSDFNTDKEVDDKVKRSTMEGAIPMHKIHVDSDN